MSLLKKKISDEIKELRPMLLQKMAETDYERIIAHIDGLKILVLNNMGSLRGLYKGDKYEMGLELGINHKTYVARLEERVVKPLKIAERNALNDEKSSIETIVRRLKKVEEHLDMVGWFSQDKYLPGLRHLGSYYGIAWQVFDPQKEPTKTAIKKMLYFYSKIKYEL